MRPFWGQQWFNFFPPPSPPPEAGWGFVVNTQGYVSLRGGWDTPYGKFKPHHKRLLQLFVTNFSVSSGRTRTGSGDFATELFAFFTIFLVVDSTIQLTLFAGAVRRAVYTLVCKNATKREGKKQSQAGYDNI
jgi:hypothetical protein